MFARRQPDSEDEVKAEQNSSRSGSSSTQSASPAIWRRRPGGLSALADTGTAESHVAAAEEAQGTPTANSELPEPQQGNTPSELEARTARPRELEAEDDDFANVIPDIEASETNAPSSTTDVAAPPMRRRHAHKLAAPEEVEEHTTVHHSLMHAGKLHKPAHHHASPGDSTSQELDMQNEVDLSGLTDCLLAPADTGELDQFEWSFASFMTHLKAERFSAA